MRGRHAGYHLLLLLLVLAAFLLILLRNAWVCDDAYITLRTVDNFVNGYGLVWNVGERVQAYTHPLWMFLLSLVYVITREAFLTTIVVSMLISLAALAVFAFRIAPSLKMAVFGLSILILSKFFIDYSTSGLENPLTHLLLAVFFYYFFFQETTEKTIGVLAFLISLLMLTRLDLILLVLPALAYMIFQVRTWKPVRYAVYGFLPLVAWELFSFWYYGSFIPNTGYAKLNTGIPAWDLLVQGTHYLEAAFRGDRLMVLTIVFAIGYTVWRRGKTGWPVAAGILLYIIYVTSCGGCFMAGRFFTGPLFVAVMTLSPHKHLLASASKTAAAFVVVFVVGLTMAYSPVYSGPQFGVGDERGLGYGIDDCRHFYFQHSGLWTADGWRTEPDHKWVDQGRQNRRDATKAMWGGGIGFLGYYSGPETYIVDVHALSDPFLAHFPAAYEKLWRIGHFVRAIPEGYMETAASGKNQIVQPELAQYYDTVSFVVSGPLSSARRMVTALKLNLGAYDHLLDSAGEVLFSLHRDELPPVVEDGTPWTAKEMIAFPGSGIRVYLDSVCRADSVEISLDGNDSYSVIFEKKGTYRDTVEVYPRTRHSSGSVTYDIAVPDAGRETGFDRLTIKPLNGDGVYAVGHIKPRMNGNSGDAAKQPE